MSTVLRQKFEIQRGSIRVSVYDSTHLNSVQRQNLRPSRAAVGFPRKNWLAL